MEHSQRRDRHVQCSDEWQQTFTANAYGTYDLLWTISNGTCTPSTADVTVIYSASPVISNAGSPQNLCNVTSTTLCRKQPKPGTGLWTLNQRPEFTCYYQSEFVQYHNNKHDPRHLYVSMDYKQRCLYSFSNTVTITNSAFPTTAYAGPEKVNCGPVSPATTETITMAGNTPSVGSGLWTKISWSGFTNNHQSQFPNHNDQWPFCWGLCF